MPWPKSTLETIQRLNFLKQTLKDQFVDRETAVDLLALATVCHEHLLLIGSPGTAKTQLVTHYTQMIDARGFHYLLTRFTEPSELFGPLDLEKFQEGTYHIQTENMLPEAQVVFLDEVFQGSSAILNTLFADRQRSPLLTMVGASNLLPDDPWLEAFADRFALRLHLPPVVDEHLDNLISQGWQLELQQIEADQLATQGQAMHQCATIKINALLELHGRLAEIELNPIQPIYATIVRELRAEGIGLSDRRVIKGLKLIAGATLLRQASVAEAQDLWPLNYFWSRLEEAEAAQNVIQPFVAEGGGPSLNLARPAADIMADISVLEEQENSVRSDVALGAHLMALNRLRQEILREHRDNQSLRQRIENVIQHNLARLESIQ